MRRPLPKSWICQFMFQRSGAINMGHIMFFVIFCKNSQLNTQRSAIFISPKFQTVVWVFIYFVYVYLKFPLVCLHYQRKHLSTLHLPGKTEGSRSRRRATCRPPAPSSRSRLYIAEPGTPPLDKWSWWSSPSPRALDALPAQRVHSGT